MGRDIIALDSLTVNNIGTFKKINEVVLPTRYGENWYKDSLNKDQIVQLGYYAELPVGAVKAKAINTSYKNPNHEASQQTSNQTNIIPNAVYIESFAVLKAYRDLGIGSRLLQYVIDKTKEKFIHQIVIHVHVDNKHAIDWYLKKGFTKDDEILKDYYKEQGLSNPDAVILSLSI
ncbi:acyl-CoA N-acyltransferase [Hyphopichia burtonii NRRL Y-1933]|uniref:Acyl-CoA N-acyltransferase n=1 Tax=Hyphopichia burtonii NRRL Y-1933 TaxID=984485 RepID=A0A1E4RQZ2_9ASCO|nr:acyl-CoA N-acyltransferase [Hyphopichia burtonii NRRL Y-1933]ODV69703.1 acyl-CoA N-acyltransferase [Hyphopichia burtonii NRRL Y-1933]